MMDTEDARVIETRGSAVPRGQSVVSFRKATNDPKPHRTSRFEGRQKERIELPSMFSLTRPCIALSVVLSNRAQVTSSILGGLFSRADFLRKIDRGTNAKTNWEVHPKPHDCGAACFRTRIDT
jgi:hypothetical protein